MLRLWGLLWKWRWRYRANWLRQLWRGLWLCQLMRLRLRLRYRLWLWLRRRRNARLRLRKLHYLNCLSGLRGFRQLCCAPLGLLSLLLIYPLLFGHYLLDLLRGRNRWWLRPRHTALWLSGGLLRLRRRLSRLSRLTLAADNAYLW